METVSNFYNFTEIDKFKLYNLRKSEKYQDEEIVALSAIEKPLTKKQYIEKIEKSIAEADNNELIADYELDAKIATW